VLNVTPGARVLPPIRVINPDTQLLAAATDSGRLLIFPMEEMPLLPRGKGVKILNLQEKKNESLVAVSALPPESHLYVYAGKRHLNMKPAEWEPFMGKRAQRGGVLPRGFTSVVGLGLE
jgi:topoisomerase-4 subunit A